MQDTLKMQVLKRKYEYIKIANREIIKGQTKREYSPKIISACSNFAQNYAKPVLRMKADGTVIMKSEVEDLNKLRLL